MRVRDGIGTKTALIAAFALAGGLRAGFCADASSDAARQDNLPGLLTGLSSILWPIIVLMIVNSFRGEIRSLFKRGGVDVEAPGFKMKIEKYLEQAQEHQASPENDKGPTSKQISSAEQVAKIAADAPRTEILDQIGSLSRDYISVRAQMPASSRRTQAMNDIFAQMRAIGIAAAPMRYELGASPSPGKRLQAIASLQMAPDLDMVVWLLDRVYQEVAHISYQALIALHIAARSDNARSSKWVFDIVIRKFDEQPANFYGDTPRDMMLAELRNAVRHLGRERNPPP